MPTGTPPNGAETSACAAAVERAFGVEERERVEVARRDRGERRLQLLDRRSFLARNASTSEQASPVHGASVIGSSSCQSSWRSAAEMSGTAIFASAPPSAGKVHAGHERGLVGREEQRDVRDVLGQARAA